MIPITIRAAVEDDLHFIYNSFLLTTRDALPASLIPKDIFFHNKPKEVDDILEVSNTIIACQPDSEDIIYSYLIYSILNDNLIIHLVYTKAAFRKLGVAKRLIESIVPGFQDNIIITTQISKSLLAMKKKYKIIYDPYCLNILKGIVK